jgi:hypothetical protein
MSFNAFRAFPPYPGPYLLALILKALTGYVWHHRPLLYLPFRCRPVPIPVPIFHDVRHARPQPPSPPPKPARRRALELLASCRDGRTEAIMLAHGFTVSQMVELVNAGFATATAERVVPGSRTIEGARVRITEAGRRALRMEGT